MLMVTQTGQGKILEMLRASSFHRKKHWQNWINIWKENAISVKYCGIKFLVYVGLWRNTSNVQKRSI